jgi:DNA-binding Lrp family transcriptional regulator
VNSNNYSELALKALDKRIVLATQEGLPLCAEPYQEVSDQVGITSELLMERLRIMQMDGRIRRIAAVPNHYKLGYVANGMSVWDVDDSQTSRMGEIIGAFDFVSHCYQRPRSLPVWRYNLFAMIHAKHRDEVIVLADKIKEVLDESYRAHDILFSTKILKKTGLRFHSN